MVCTMVASISGLHRKLYVAKNGQQGEKTSRIQDMEGGSGGGKRPCCLEEAD